MATNTTNYGFKKPDESDFYDVADQNKNWDLADEALKNLDTPTFEDYTGSTAVPSATDAIDQIKSKGKLGALLSNIKAAFKGACLIGHIVNNCVTDNAGLPLSAAQGKVLKDLYTQLYSDLNTTNNNLSNAGIPTVKNITDLYAIKKSGFYCYDAGASNAPMSSRGGMVIANYLSDAWISLNVVPYALSKIYTNSKYNSTWTGWSELASKDDLPNIFTTTLGTSNQESNHATTIKRLWNSFPERQVFACNLVDSNNFCVFGFTYGNHKYGAVLYLAFNSCGIVKCINGNFSDTEL